MRKWYVRPSLQTYSLENSSKMNRERRPSQVVHGADDGVTAKNGVFRAHLPGVGFTAQILGDLIRIERKGNLAFLEFHCRCYVVKTYAVGGGRRNCGGLAITVHAFSETEKTNLFAQTPAQAEISRRVGRPKMGSKRLIHIWLVYIFEGTRNYFSFRGRRSQYYFLRQATTARSRK